MFVVSGFGFTTGIDVVDDGTIYALDGFAAEGERNRIWVFTLIPEPGTATLLLAGLVALGVRRRSRSGSLSMGSVTTPAIAFEGLADAIAVEVDGHQAKPPLRRFS